jgi:tetratricopeptide (TPR) repeat protein
MLMGAELKKAPDVEKYFKTLADSASSPKAKSKILFALAAYVSEQDKARALTIMNEAYNPEIVYAPQDLDYYGLALIAQKQLDKAGPIFDKLAKDYAVPPGVAPTGAALAVQEAQASVLFGRAKIAEAQGKTAEAAKLFEQLKALYAWSPKVLEADFGIAQALRNEKKYDDALILLNNITRAQTATAELRANSMVAGGDIMAERMAAATDAKDKQEYLDAAINYYLKIAQFYGGVPTAASRGLWLGAQLIEQQTAATTDAKFKAQQLEKARAAYQQLVKDYGNSEFASKAQERLNALGK